MSELKEKSRIHLVDPDRAIGDIRRLFAELRTQFAGVPSLFKAVANSPVALEGLMGLHAVLASGEFNEKIREQLALAIAESNLCSHSLSAHIAMAAKIGMEPAEIDDARRANAANAKTDAILKLARSIVVQRGELSDADLSRARAAGLTDGVIVETVANVALNTFENYMGHLARFSSDTARLESDET